MSECRIDSTAFVTVTVARQSDRIVDVFETTVVRFAEVVEVRLMAGTSGHLLCPVTPTLDSYESFLKKEAHARARRRACADSVRARQPEKG